MTLSVLKVIQGEQKPWIPTTSHEVMILISADIFRLKGFQKTSLRLEVI